MRSIALWFVLATVMISGCSRNSGTSTSSATQERARQPQNSAAAGQAGVQRVTGTVVETMDAANYTYVRVKTDTDEVWAATGQFKVAVGDRVTVPLEMPMQNFQSPTLKREFPLIYFTSHIDREGGGAPTAPMPAHSSATQGPASSAPEASAATPVTPAEGGMTVADVWAKRAALSGKTVTVRGRVVKFNGAILDRNWLHIQDGTGDAKDGSNDLTITSQDAAKVGDIVTVTGKVAVKKDFGAGYTYAVMIEGATLVAK